ncbi:MAG: YdeI/OmpD-associated family protein [Candidatus Eisenbacteria bacterium]|uniref:YdeI/OmpD-associated family protein n=1 Tax=Eiseniibacteriota bacterium TaxID=2212470 RepID=A0A933S9V1_UNCEI|nr:YdeI/OmpD-associated family protein [Candidatus Eisenbacteria bacterium]
MPSTDPRVDAYIAKSAPFARPILEELRARVHAACPNVEETIKWGFPNFVHEGALLCSMAAFKQHCTFGFWKGKLLRAAGLKVSDEAMGQMGRLESVKDLPGKAEFRRLVKAAMTLNEGPTRVARPVTKPGTRKPIPVPADLKAALARNARARGTFESFAPSHRREYLEWITEAKRPETRAKRLAQTIEWLAEGKRRNWKYEGC